METYKKTQQFTPTANVQLGTEVYPVTITHEETLDGVVFIVEEFEFLDSNPANKDGNAVKQTPVATIGAPVQTAQTPVQVSAPANTANAMNPPISADVATQAPVANCNCDEECPF